MSKDDGIGTRKEKSLHAALKARYAGAGGSTEIDVGQYVCDAVTSDGTIVEIQTGNFGAIMKKIAALAQRKPVLVVHPIAVKRTIELYDKNGELKHRRASPKKGSVWDLFSVLIRAPGLPLIPGVSIEVALVEELEIRADDGKGSWRRKGVSIVDRRLDRVQETRTFRSLADYSRILPDSLDGDFLVKDLARAARLRQTTARKALYVLSRIGIVEEAGKKGNAKLFKRVPAQGS